VTVTRGTIPNGTIVLRDGKIAAAGANVSIPAGADVVDATGLRFHRLWSVRGGQNRGRDSGPRHGGGNQQRFRCQRDHR